MVYLILLGGNHIAIAFYKVAYISSYLQFVVFLSCNCIALDLEVDGALLKGIKTVVAKEFVQA